MTVITVAGNSNEKTLDSWVTLEQQLNRKSKLSGKFKIDAQQLGGIMTFENLGGKFKKQKNLKIKYKCTTFTLSAKIRMDNPIATNTTINSTKATNYSE